MKTLKNTLWIVAAALLLLPLAGLNAGDNAPAEGKGKHREAVEARLAKRDVKIEKHIERLGAAIAKHPNAPANVRADAEKVLADLDAKKTTLAKLSTDVQTKNKEGCKADRAEMKADCATCKADRGTLKADRKAYRAGKKAAKGAKAGKGNKGQQDVQN